MKFALLAIVLSYTTSVAASVVSVGPYKRGDHISPRPKIVYSPEQPTTSPPTPKTRCKTCFIESHGDGVTDDSDYILDAFHKCNNGGHAVFREGVTYLVGTAMDWTFLNHIDIGE
jgi:galacturan 1,4-alpha-galacturonidase